MPGRRFAQASNREIVCFSAAGSEDDLVLLRADQRCYFASGPIDRRARLLTEAMNARRVAKRLNDCSRHRVRNARIDGRRSTMIQVNSAFRHKSRQLRREMRHLNGSLPQRRAKITKGVFFAAIISDSIPTLRGWLSQDATAKQGRTFFGRTQYELL